MSTSVIRSRAVPMLVDHVDTDQIIPARFLKTVDREGLGERLFADLRGPEFVLDAPEHVGARILLAGVNFGCGSSREHAPWALLGAGYAAVIAASFADIFFANALRNGLLPVAPAAGDYQRLVDSVLAEPAVELEIDLARTEVRGVGEPIAFHVDAFSKDCLLRGIDRIEYLLEHEEAIRRFEVRHG